MLKDEVIVLVSLSISDSIKKKIPEFKIGVLTYRDIVVDDSPKMLNGRIDFFQEELMLDLEKKAVADVSGVSIWRKTFKTLGIDPSRYRPSNEALYRRIKKGNRLPSIHSAADLNNFFSLKYEIPLGIYDTAHLEGQIELRIGKETDYYEGINGRDMSMEGKLTSADGQGAFGSPIVDSKRTMVTTDTTSALQMVYLKPSMDVAEANKLLDAMKEMFSHIHGGEAESHLVV